MTCPTPLQPTIPRSRWLAALLLAAAKAKLPMQVGRVGPHSHCVRGQLALGSSANQNFISDASFVVTHTSVAVIDAQGSPRLAERLGAEIRMLKPVPISEVIITHYHANHIHGLSYFKTMDAHITADAAAREYIQSDTARLRLRLEASRTNLAP